MIRMKGRSYLRQYTPQKPIKWGVKVFAAADVTTSYLIDFNVYTGAVQGQTETGLTHAVVVNLTDSHRNAGHVVFTDNFYTSPTLADSLLAAGTHLVGTLRVNRLHVPQPLKKVKDFDKSNRGSMRYVQSGNKVFVQWKDKHTVTTLSTYHKATDYVMKQRNTKEGGRRVVLEVKMSNVVQDYNHGMGGIDVFDQRCTPYRMCRKSRKFWKAVFFDFIEIAAVNSMILFEAYRATHPELNRPASYDHEEFRVALTRQLGSIEDDAPVPIYHPPRPPPKRSAAAKAAPLSPGSHLPRFTPGTRRNCFFCYQQEHAERKYQTKCVTCDWYFHIEQRNCFEAYHSRKGM